ncbi:MAG: proton-conducting membrane transporter [Rhizobiaceae bacterium]
MSYLVAQMLFYLLVALLLGVLLGWIVWGKRAGGLAGAPADRLYQENAGLRRDLEACGEARATLERRLADALAAGPGTISASDQAPANNAISLPVSPERPISAERSDTAAEETQPTALMSHPSSMRPKKAGGKKTVTHRPEPPQKSKKMSAAAEAEKPKGMVQPDDLRRIIGIGPVNERLLHGEGVRRFAQIAAWKDADVKHIEEVLQFDGRIERERWIEQASLLAAGDDEEFAKRFPTSGSSKNT